MMFLPFLFFNILSDVPAEEKQTHRIKAAVQKGKRPVFQPLISNISNPLSDHNQIDYTFNKPGGVYTESHEGFVCSTVTVEKVTFVSNYAFGPGFLFGSGGAIFAYESAIIINDAATFESNEAVVGGSISIINSDFMINSATDKQVLFINNRAYFMAGAISSLFDENVRNPLTNSKTDYTNKKVFFQIQNANFTENIAKEFCGAICLSAASDCWFQSCFFLRNKAQHSAGAVGVYNTIRMLFCDCVFKENSCGYRTFSKVGDKNVPFGHFRQFGKPLGTNNIPRGGGAILFKVSKEVAKNFYENIVGDPNRNKYYYNISMETEHCIFVNNECKHDEGYNQTNVANSPGFDLYIHGPDVVTYQSYEDRFFNFRNVSIATRKGAVEYFWGTRFHGLSEFDKKRFFESKKGPANIGKYEKDYNDALKPYIFDKTQEFVQIDATPNNQVFATINNIEMPANTPWQTKPPMRTTMSHTPPLYGPSKNGHLSSKPRTFATSYSPSKAFTFSQYFTKSNGFSRSVIFSLSNDFSKSDLFTHSEDFSKSGLFSHSEDFSKSEFFTHSNGFSKSEYFSQSGGFSKSGIFSNSAAFSISTAFTKSLWFTSSKKFSQSDNFVPTKVFGITDEFTSSSGFSQSKKFSNSEKFTLSEGFSRTKYFTKSNLFTQSVQFEASNNFEGSKEFAASNGFTKSAIFTNSDALTPSIVFTESIVFNPSDEFTSSSNFVPSSIFTSSDAFTPSKTVRGNININVGKDNKNKFPLAAIIGIVCGVVILIIIIVFLVLFFKKKEKKSTESAEMEAENTVSVEGTTATITADNPLWAQRYIMNDTDDPFKDDFEEALDNKTRKALKDRKNEP